MHQSENSISCPSETQLLGWLAARPNERSEQLDRHIDACSHCRLLTASLLDPGSSSPHPSAPEFHPTLGRYQILRPLGRGGMGIVYSALDRELDRKVALKFLTSGDDAQNSKRLLREGKALARLSHPHVVTLYDVLQVKGDVVLSMELIEGPTLSQWLKFGDRTWREVLSVFVQAGQGLAAAHERGLVHRDFKPGNVLIDSQGNARVADFGLASASASGLDRETPSRTGSRSSNYSPVGTVGFVAPELFNGGRCTALSDQYSFCVGLSQALKEVSAPRSLMRVVSRGLSENPTDRFPSMSALLAALRVVPRYRVTSRRLAMAVVATAVAAVVGARIGDRQSLCRESDLGLSIHWGPEQRQLLQSSLARKGADSKVFSVVSSAIDTFAEQWNDTSKAVCRSARISGTNTERMLEIQTLCLDQRRTELSKLLRLIESVDSSQVWRAAEAVQSLSAPSTCKEINRLGRFVSIPSSKQLRDGIGRASSKLAESVALVAAGQPNEALINIEAAERENALEHYPPLRAEVLAAKGSIMLRLGRTDDAERSLSSAIDLAESIGHDEVAARAWLDLFALFGENRGDVERAKDAGRRASAAVNKLGDLKYRIEYLNNVGKQQRLEGYLKESEDTFSEGLRLLQGAGREKSEMGVVLLMNLGTTLIQLERWREANQTLERAKTLIESQLGTRNVHYAECLSYLGIAQLYLDNWKSAQALQLLALELQKELFGPQSLAVSFSLLNLSWIAWEADDLATALKQVEQTIAIRSAEQGREGPLMSPALAVQARLLYLAGDLRNSEGVARTAYSLALKALPADSAEFNTVMILVSEVFLDVGKSSEAYRILEMTLPRVVHRNGASTASARTIQGVLGRAAAKLVGREAEAERLLRLALTSPLIAAPPGTEGQLAHTLGRILLKQRKLSEAHEYLQVARKGFDRYPKTYRAEVREVEKLLKSIRAF